MRYIYNYIITLRITFKSIAFALLYHLLSFKQSYKQDCPQDINKAATKSLTSDPTFSNNLLIVDTYSNIPKVYGMEKITTEEVLVKLDMFQSRFGKIYQFGWWDLERISPDASTQFTSMEFKEECQTR